jgi:preprotein translocase subunit SecY
MLVGVSEPPRVRPVSLVERVVTTALVPVLVVLGDRIPLSDLNGGQLRHSKGPLSPFAVGLAPFITAYGLVELAALVVPPWRRWRHEARGRVRLERWSGALGIALAAVQALGVAMALETTDLVTPPGWGTRAEHTATLVGGACLLALAARWATRRGLVNGYVLWWTAPVLIDLARGGAFREAAVRGSGRDVVLLAVALAVAVAATLIAVAGGDTGPAAVRVDDTTYRGGSTAAPRPWFPIPVSSIQPIGFASAVLLFPAVLHGLDVPGMGALQSVLQRGDVVFDVAYVALVAVAMLVAVALLYRPDEVSAFMRRLGSVSDQAARADTSAALRRALLPTLAYLLTLVVASWAAGGKSSAVPAMATLALATAAMVDLVRSTVAHGRASDLVCVTQVHDAYAVAALRAALRTEGIDARPRGMAVLSLLQAFAPYAPVELFVRAGDVERASALLRHWAAGEAKPVTPPGSTRGSAPVPWSLGARTAAFVGLAAAALAVGLVPRAAEGPPAKRADIAIVRVDDDADPLRGVREDDAPEGVGVFAETAPLGQGRTERRSYARVALRSGESLQAAWARVLPWLQRLPLPPGDHWAWEPAMEPDDTRDNEEGMTTFHVTALRTFLLSGEPVVTTADVEAAHASLDEQGMGRASVLVTLTPAGGERFYQVTEEWLGRRLAILIDDHIESAPVIRAPIRGGHLSVTMGAGAPDQQLADARRLAASLR